MTPGEAPTRGRLNREMVEVSALRRGQQYEARPTIAAPWSAGNVLQIDELCVNESVALDWRHYDESSREPT